MPLISSPPSTSRRDFEPHGPEGTRETSSSARSVSNYHSFKYVPSECDGMTTHLSTSPMSATEWLPWQLKAVMHEPFRRSLMKGTGL